MLLGQVRRDDGRRVSRELEMSQDAADDGGLGDGGNELQDPRLTPGTALHGVVDVNSRVHGIENLYIAGSSVFPTAGHANPTFTIAAMAIRLADHLKMLVAP